MINVIFQVINIDSGEAVGPHEKGELCIRGPQVMKGYLNNPKATQAAIDQSGWLHTGLYSQTRLIRHFRFIRRGNLKTLKPLPLTPMLNQPFN